MDARTRHRASDVAESRERIQGARPVGGRTRTAPGPGSRDVWKAISKGSFAVLGYVTPAGEPRTSGVVYKAIGRRLYVVVGAESWKARHVGATGPVSVTVTVRRGGLLSLIAPIPPATISFHGAAVVHAAGSPEVRALGRELGQMLPEDLRDSACVIEIVPEGRFCTYGVGVSLTKMRDPAASQARVPVS